MTNFSRKMRFLPGNQIYRVFPEDLQKVGKTRFSGVWGRFWPILADFGPPGDPPGGAPGTPGKWRFWPILASFLGPGGLGSS